MLFFISVRDVEGLGQEEWGGGDTPGSQGYCPSLGLLVQVVTPLDGSVFSSVKWVDGL